MLVAIDDCQCQCGIYIPIAFFNARFSAQQELNHLLITITNDKGRLSKGKIERTVRRGEKYADEDKASREKIEARNGLENYAVTKRLTHNLGI